MVFLSLEESVKMDCRSIEKRKFSEGSSGPDTRAHSVNVEESPNLSSYQVSAGNNIDVQSKNIFLTIS